MSTTTPRWGRKATVIMGTVLLAALAFGTTTRTWLNVTLPAATVATPDVAVSGSDAATAVTAFAVVGVAAALAAAIAGRIARWIIAVIIVVAGVGVATASYRIISDPLQGAAGAIGKAIGVSSAEGTVAELTPMPYAALVAGILIALAGIWLALAGRYWTTSRRYAPTAEAGTPDSDSSDAGTSDAGTPGTAAATGTAGTTDAGKKPAAGPPIDEIDSWDRLTRGEDPTDHK
ncbi:MULTISPECIES: Trp biosynthesis-associated membrane protein [unclassified Arthrobacter]|uniref:Trp biosynthesis-associated membrane protein n=1 Tax=unclassified Arthrobacter TaxID=235627 RepID=UPI0024DF604C|nr:MULTISPECIES: Trp biosynthesis-associated membrane protein [unclassified Arthrobacter]MCC9145222.1 Trp biosynthesis-associated membrane protein [Arthrobacter sp. zg-Y919]MDK1276450.1 Trp biosynthesis-associated membrane protein [Arthrobacter sp. zg.Y919]WIB01951.1 Trp biosynthesis-associated membrane protein [Arthrobacter sp. zg-Y919]